MKKQSLTNQYLSAFCLEISMLLHTGMPVSEGLAIVLEDDVDPKTRSLLESISDTMQKGYALSYALEQTGVFPKYLLHMVSIGEKAGRLEEIFKALSDYYDYRERLAGQVRGALLYPSILLILILVVIVVVLVKVMPVFNTVYAQLGTQMTGLAGGFLKIGQKLSGIMPILVIILAAAAGFVALLGFNTSLGGRLLEAFGRKRGDGGISGKINAARSASALAIGMASGLPIDQSLELAAIFSEDVPQAAAKYADCRQRIDAGENLAVALKKAGIFNAMYSQLVFIGVRSGNGVSAMAEVARRMENEAEEAIERSVRSVEPVMIITVSVIIGMILLSVMLPLINIMSAIG